MSGLEVGLVSNALGRMAATLRILYTPKDLNQNLTTMKLEEETRRTSRFRRVEGEVQRLGRNTSLTVTTFWRRNRHPGA